MTTSFLQKVGAAAKSLGEVREEVLQQKYQVVTLKLSHTDATREVVTAWLNVRRDHESSSYNH